MQPSSNEPRRPNKPDQACSIPDQLPSAKKTTFTPHNESPTALSQYFFRSDLRDNIPLCPILDSKWTAYIAYPAVIIGSAAWGLGQINQQALDRLIPYIPYTTDNWGNFAYPVIGQIALKIGLKTADKIDGLNHAFKSQLKGKILLLSPEITALTSTALMVALEVFKVTDRITPSLDDIPAAIAGGILGYLSIGRKNKRFLLRKEINPDISYGNSMRLDLENRFYRKPVLACMELWENFWGKFN